jgi:DNA helicase-2/ATP-dependent DNA helicase PcrA
MAENKFPSTTWVEKKSAFTAKGWLSDDGKSGGEGGLPWDLRADAEDLPELRYAEAQDVVELEEAFDEFTREAGHRSLAEERRVAYVALTRARSHLRLTGSWRIGTAATLRSPSTFLKEIVAKDLVRVDGWAPKPDEEDASAAPAPREGTWPSDDPLGDRREPVSRAAEAVRVAASHQRPGMTLAQGADALAELNTDLAREAAYLLKEMASAHQGAEVQLPASVKATAVGEILKDAQAYAVTLRRPVPREPQGSARIGTAFHERVEGFLQAGRDGRGKQEALDGAETWAGRDTSPGAERVRELMEAFEASVWANPDGEFTFVEAEADMEVVVDGRVIRARADAVFTDRDGTTVIVDWKTGHRGPDGARATHLEQVGLYRAVFAHAMGVPVDHIRAAVHYVPDGYTAWLGPGGPDDTLDALAARLREAVV